MHSMLRMARNTFICIILLLLLPLAGCSTGESSAPPAPSDEAALQLIRGLDPSVMYAAFERMRGIRHEMRRTVEMEAASHEPYRLDQRLWYAGSGTYELVDAERTARPEGGVFARLHGDDGDVEIGELPELVLDEDPAFLDPRNESSFTFRLVADSTIDGRDVRVIEFERHPDENRGRPYDAGRLHVDASTQTLIGFDLVLREETFFFSEAARRKVHLVRDDVYGWIPAEVMLESDIKNFLAPVRTVRNRWVFDVSASEAPVEL